MKESLFCILLFFTISFSAQEKEIDSIGVSDIEIASVSSDSLTVDEKELYIKDYTNRFNVKLEASNSLPFFNTLFNDNYFQVEPNLGTKYAAVLSYGFLSVRLGIRAKGSEESLESKGEPKSFRLHLKLLFDRWSHQFEYNKITGYYISESEDPVVQFTTNPHVQFPDLTTSVFNGVSAYKLNDNYSIRATISQTERQIKSAGSLIPSLGYSIYSIRGTDNYLDTNGDVIYREEYSYTNGFTSIVNLGYYYTFVYKNWFFNAFVIPGIGADFNKNTNFTPTSKSTSSQTDFILSAQAGSGIGFNAKNFFGGAFVIRTVKDQTNKNSDTEFKSTKDAFSIYLGYRFKAPKQISKPIDDLEQKIPRIKKKGD